MVLSLVRSAREIFENGPLFGMDQIVNVAKKHDQFGIRYHLSTCKLGLRKQKRLYPVRYKSARFHNDHTVAVIGDASCSEKEAPITKIMCF